MVASVVLNGAKSSTRVSEETRSRILEAAARLGYRPNEAARGLMRRRMDAIGVVAVIDIGEEINLYILEVLNGILEAASEYGQNTTVFSIKDWQRDEARVLQFCDGRIDGMVLIAPSFSSDFLKHVRSHPPWVTLHSNHVLPGVPGLDVDNEGGAHAIVQYLVAQGHRRILHITGPRANTDAQLRVAGYRRALEEAGIPFDEALVLPGDYNTYAGRECMKTLLEKGGVDTLPTAIFCASDAIAYGCMEILAKYGLRVPDDISVAGFDDTLTARMTSPPLTTVRQPFRMMGRRAVERLLSAIREEDAAEAADGDASAAVPQVEVLPVELVVRASVAPPTR
jgi:LacI family transcriptional regulator